MPLLHKQEGARGKPPHLYSVYALRISSPAAIQHGGTFLTVIPTGGCGDGIGRAVGEGVPYGVRMVGNCFVVRAPMISNIFGAF